MTGGILASFLIASSLLVKLQELEVNWIPLPLLA